MWGVMADCSDAEVSGKCGATGYNAASQEANRTMWVEGK